MSFALLRLAALIICLILPTTLTRAETLPLPQSLIGAATDQGEALFLDADAREAFFPLASNFVTQQNQAFCGVASMVMVLNALELPAPAVPAFDPYRTFTQDNVLDSRTEAVLPVEVIKKMGMTLDQLGGLLAVQPVTVAVHHAADSSVEVFRNQARNALAAPGQFVIVNYLRKAIGQERGGHISPLAAFDAESDRFLILDVARYKYPPVWVKTAELFAAMNTRTLTMRTRRGAMCWCQRNKNFWAQQKSRRVTSGLFLLLNSNPTRSGNRCRRANNTCPIYCWH